MMAKVTDLGQIPEVADDILVLLDEDPSMWLSSEAMVHAHSLAALLVKVRQVSRMLLAAEERAAWERIAAQEHAEMVAGVADRASDPVEWNDPIEGDNPW